MAPKRRRVERARGPRPGEENTPVIMISSTGESPRSVRRGTPEIACGGMCGEGAGSPGSAYRACRMHLGLWILACICLQPCRCPTHPGRITRPRAKIAPKCALYTRRDRVYMQPFDLKRMKNRARVCIAVPLPRTRYRLGYRTDTRHRSRFSPDAAALQHPANATCDHASAAGVPDPQPLRSDQYQRDRKPVPLPDLRARRAF